MNNPHLAAEKRACPLRGKRTALCGLICALACASVGLTEKTCLTSGLSHPSALVAPGSIAWLGNPGGGMGLSIEGGQLRCWTDSGCRGAWAEDYLSSLGIRGVNSVLSLRAYGGDTQCFVQASLNGGGEGLFQLRGINPIGDTGPGEGTGMGLGLSPVAGLPSSEKIMAWGLRRDRFDEVWVIALGQGGLRLTRHGGMGLEDWPVAWDSERDGAWGGSRLASLDWGDFFCLGRPGGGLGGFLALASLGETRVAYELLPEKGRLSCRALFRLDSATVTSFAEADGLWCMALGSAAGPVVAQGRLASPCRLRLMDQGDSCLVLDAKSSLLSWRAAGEGVSFFSGTIDGPSQDWICDVKGPLPRWVGLEPQVAGDGYRRLRLDYGEYGYRLYLGPRPTDGRMSFGGLEEPRGKPSALYAAWGQPGLIELEKNGRLTLDGEARQALGVLATDEGIPPAIWARGQCYYPLWPINEGQSCRGAIIDGDLLVRRASLIHDAAARAIAFASYSDGEWGFWPLAGLDEAGQR